MSTNWPNFRSIRSYAARNPKLAWGSLLAVGGLFYLKVWLPATGLSIPCPIHEITGLYCPGCGMTRAMLALLQGDLPQAFRYNTMLLALPPLYAAYVWLLRKQRLRTSQWLMGVMITAAVSYGLLRNIPLTDWLAPTDLSSP